MSALLDKHLSLPTLKNVLSLHCFIEYYDTKKLHQLTSGTAPSSFFQATVTTGFVNITDYHVGHVTFVVEHADDCSSLASFVKSISPIISPSSRSPPPSPPPRQRPPSYPLHRSTSPSSYQNLDTSYSLTLSHPPLTCSRPSVQDYGEDVKLETKVVTSKILKQLTLAIADPARLRD